MLSRCPIALALALTLSIATGAALADPPGLKPLAIGADAPDFKLPGVDGKTYTLKDFADAKALVVVFTCNHCLTAQAYESRISKLYADYKDRGVALVAISPNDPKAVRLDELGYTDLDDSFEAMKIRAKDRNFAFPYLYDGDTQATSLAYGVLKTPHVYIFDKDRKLRYVGGIDDSEVKTVKAHYAADAIEAILAGKPVPVETSRVVGCSTKWADKRDSVKQYFAKADAEPVSLESIDESGLAKLAKNDTKKLLMVNLWATWCGPCVAELPELVEIHRMYRKRDFQLVTISLDKPSKFGAAFAVLKENHLSTRNYLPSIENIDKLAEALDPKWDGAIPYTLLIAPGGKVIYRKSGAIEPLDVKRAIVGFTGRTY